MISDLISVEYRISFTPEYRSHPSSNSYVYFAPSILSRLNTIETTISIFDSYTYMYACTSTYLYIHIHIYGRYQHRTNVKSTYLQLTRFRFPYVYHRTTVVPNGQVAQCLLRHIEAASLMKCNITLHSRC